MLFVYFHCLLTDRVYVGYMCAGMQTWWSRKEVSNELQLHKQRKTHVTFARPYFWKYTNSIKPI